MELIRNNGLIVWKFESEGDIEALHNEINAKKVVTKNYRVGVESETNLFTVFDDERHRNFLYVWPYSESSCIAANPEKRVINVFLDKVATEYAVGMTESSEPYTADIQAVGCESDRNMQLVIQPQI